MRSHRPGAPRLPESSTSRRDECPNSPRPRLGRPDPQCRSRAELGSGRATRVASSHLISLGGMLWVGGSVGQVWLLSRGGPSPEPGGHSRQGHPMWGGASPAAPLLPTVQEEAHTAVPRLLPWEHLPPGHPVPAAAPHPEAPWSEGSPSPRALQRGPQEQGLHWPWAQVTGTGSWGWLESSPPCSGDIQYPLGGVPTPHPALWASYPKLTIR